MDIPSVASIRSLVKWVTLCWYRQRRVPAVRLWWLWLITILIHLFLLVSGVVLPPSVAPAEGRSDGSTWRLPSGSWVGGLAILLLILRPGEAPLFPWLRWRVRLVVRRRRLAAIYTRFVDGSLQLCVEDLNTFQLATIQLYHTSPLLQPL